MQNNKLFVIENSMSASIQKDYSYGGWNLKTYLAASLQKL